MFLDTRLNQLNAQREKLFQDQSRLYDDLDDRSKNSNLLITRLQKERDEKLESIKIDYDRKIDNCQRDFNSHSLEINRKLASIKSELPNLGRQIENRTDELKKEEEEKKNTNRFQS
ncbi:hypothetical protein COZ82_02445 [Candidatus Kaiserbacteria bacterium CG_4_8_14_3_um_filter_38_9]|uniref:Uncharacterized protein n=1 Tax=Candidatus Kaiserbacteria bacterium CG_4_8_14_3_um_filter_38_9 TaxID=1974599 RepID=A0A2M7INN5_9BACT|nr:MAG: hypothetical protein COZ82_02445 [Candidatus Kaiserbacteria bacterium CG_4_8_14_3_um_filter_38_9]